jgi:hypothetical protein
MDGDGESLRVLERQVRSAYDSFCIDPD